MTSAMRPLQGPLQSLSRFVRPPAPRQAPTATRPPRRHPPTLRAHPTRPYSSTPPKPGSNPQSNPTNTNTTAPPPSQSAATTTRAERILSRLPRPLQRYASRLRGAPVTHVVAFLILHEITAVVPLLGLFGLFHYTAWAPAPYMLEHYGGYVREGAGRFERYFRRKGWFGFGEGDTEGVEAGEGERGGEAVATQREEGSGSGRGQEDGRGQEEKEVLARWEADPRYRVVVEVALAYAITKVLLPVRIVGSVWATPWFAGVLTRAKRVVGRRG